MRSHHDVRSAADDLPFYDDQPSAISGRGWLAVVAATVIAFLTLTLLPVPPAQGALSLIPAILFTAIPLATFARVSGGRWKILFRPYGLRLFGLSILFAIATLALSLATGLLLSTFAPLASNPVGDILADAGPVDIMVFIARTFIQLIGEEAVTILPLLAVMWLCFTRLRLSRGISLAVAIVVSTVWFAAMHLPTYDWNVAQCFGIIGVSRLVLTWAYLHTRNLWVSSGAHILNDWSIFAIGYAGSHSPIGM